MKKFFASLILIPVLWSAFSNRAVASVSNQERLIEPQRDVCYNTSGDAFLVEEAYAYGVFPPVLFIDFPREKLNRTPAYITGEGYFFDLVTGDKTYVNTGDIVVSYAIWLDPDCNEHVIVWHPESRTGGLLPGYLVSYPIGW